MNQKQIEAFRLVMLRGSMTAAAEELGTSQPSISRLIGELEASTGLALFTRNGGRIQATDAGSAFYREVDRSFVGLEKLAHSAREIRQFGSGRLRLVAAPVLALSFVPLVIERFLAAYPRIAVSLEMRSEGTIQRWASSAYCDVGFATTTPDAFGVTSAELYRLAGVCALPAKHPLAAREGSQTSTFVRVRSEPGCVPPSRRFAGALRQVRSLLPTCEGCKIPAKVRADDYDRRVPR